MRHLLLGIVWVSVLVFLLFPQENAEAQCRALYQKQVVQQVVKPYYTYAQPIVYQQAYSPVRYFLGEDLQVQALADKLSTPLANQLAPKIVDELQARGLVVAPSRNGNGSNGNGHTNGNGGVSGNGGGGLAIQEPRVDPRHPLLAAKCFKCHSGDDPKGGVAFDYGISDASFRRLVTMFRSEKDVPKGMKSVIAYLTPEEKGQITEELSDFFAEAPGVEDAGRVPPRPQEPLPPPRNGESGEGGLR